MTCFLGGTIVLLKLHNLLQHPLGNNRRLDVEMFLNLNTLGSSIPASSHRKHFVPIQATPNEQDHLESALPQLSFGAPQASHRGPGSLARPSAALMACGPVWDDQTRPVDGTSPSRMPTSWGVADQLGGLSGAVQSLGAEQGEARGVPCSSM